MFARIFPSTEKLWIKKFQLYLQYYDSVEVTKYVVMPNHIHMIIIIRDTINYSGRTQFAPTVSRVVKQFKGSVTKKIGHSIWQRSFHDHIIRDENDYLRIWKYIDENPSNWMDDCYYSD